MITELLGLAGSGVAGSIFGILSDVLQARAENKKLETQLEIQRRANESQQKLNYVREVSSTSRFYSVAFVMLCLTYSACTIICFLYPDVTIHTFNPDDEPRKYSILWGFIAFERHFTQVYTISTGGLGFSLLHPIAFMIGSVITGINPRNS